MTVTDHDLDRDDEILAEAEPGGGRRTLVGALAVAAVLAVLVAVLVVAKRPDPPSALAGKPAPSADRPFQDLDGNTVRVVGLRGRYVFLNFFASWCVPCQREHPELVRFHEKHAAAGDVTVLQVLFDNTPSDAKRFFASRGQPPWPVLVDPDGQFALDYGVRGPPETFLIGPDGTVLVNIKGAVDEAGLDDLLRRAKAGPR